MNKETDHEKKHSAEGGQVLPIKYRIFMWGFAVMVAMWLYSMFPDNQDERPVGENWKEEVRLMNGELLVVERQHIYGDVYKPDFFAGHVTDAKINYEYQGRKYRWQHKDVSPRALQIEPGGRHVIVTNIGNCGAWQNLGKPESAYVAFANDGDGWREISIDEVDPSTVFNLAPFGRDRSTMKPQELVRESAWRFKDDVHHESSSRIVSGLKDQCWPKKKGE